MATRLEESLTFSCLSYKKMAIYILPRILLLHFYQHFHKRFNVFTERLLQVISAIACSTNFHYYLSPKTGNICKIQ
jgi:hypothetical protein